jgi:transposase
MTHYTSRMLKNDSQSTRMTCYAPQDHPLRMIRSLIDGVLERLSPRFNRLYARAGRPSIAPEKLLRALLGQEIVDADRPCHRLEF